MMHLTPHGWLDLRSVPDVLHGQALASFAGESPDEFLFYADNQAGLSIVADNWRTLTSRGCYERALLNAYTGARTNWSHWPMATIRTMFALCDRERLRAAGGPCPDSPVTVYRGVAGRGRARRTRGMSWTRDPDRAKWFATRWPSLDRPEVHATVADPQDVLCAADDRGEAELILYAGKTRLFWAAGAIGGGR